MAQQIKKTNSQGGNVIGGMGKSATSIGNSGLDFYLTVGKFSYDWMAEKQPGKSSWKVYIGIHDTYDYDKVDPLPSAFPTKYITLVANHANRCSTSRSYCTILREHVYGTNFYSLNNTIKILKIFKANRPSRDHHIILRKLYV